MTSYVITIFWLALIVSALTVWSLQPRNQHKNYHDFVITGDPCPLEGKEHLAWGEECVGCLHFTDLRAHGYDIVHCHFDRNALCDQDCNNCDLMHDTPANRMLQLVLNALQDENPDTNRIVNGICPNLTVCTVCHIDDFCHGENCPIVAIVNGD